MHSTDLPIIGKSTDEVVDKLRMAYVGRNLDRFSLDGQLRVQTNETPKHHRLLGVRALALQICEVAEVLRVPSSKGNGVHEFAVIKLKSGCEPLAKMSNGIPEEMRGEDVFTVLTTSFLTDASVAKIHKEIDGLTA